MKLHKGLGGQWSKQRQQGSELGNEFGEFEGLWEDRLELSER